MRLKHNKKRNTAFVYEALVRELTESVVKNNKNKQNKIVSIIKDHFGRGSKLNQELELYKTIYETRDMEKSTAEKIVVEVKEKHNSLNKRELLNENQKELMGHYISSFSDNGVEFKTYLNEEIGRLKTKLKKAEKEEDTEMSTKVAKIYEILDNTKNKPVDTETLEIVLQTQELLEEIEDDS